MTDKNNEAEMLAHRVADDLRVFVSKMRRQLRASRPSGLTSPQLLVLLRLETSGAMTITNLANAEGMRPQSMSTTVAGLEKTGLVERSSDPSDGRQSILSLTGDSRKLIQHSRSERSDWLYKNLRSRLTGQEQKELAKAMALLRKLIDD